jgi:hypothetical protein
MNNNSSSMNVVAAICVAAACACSMVAHADESGPNTSLPQREVISDGPGLMSSDHDSDTNLAKCDHCGECEASCQCCECGAPGQFWLRDEYVGWWAKGGHTPTLVATSPDGILPATTPLYGNATYNGGYRSGNWTQGGMWFDCCKNWGIQGDFFFVGRASSPFFARSDGDPVLARPFTDATTGTPSQELIAFPSTVVGSVSVSNYNSLSGGGVLLRHNLCCWNNCCDSPCDDGCGDCFCGQDCGRLDFVAGYRHYQFNDNVGVREHLTSIDQTGGTGNAVGTQFDVNDSFRTQNNFNGAEFGVILDRYRGRWMYEGSARLALGTMQQIVSINGSTVVSFPGQPTAFNQGGILALSSNIGSYSRNNFAAIPQLSGRVGYRLTERLTFLVGYTAIFFGQVARAGEQIDTTVNPNLIPPPVQTGPSRPSFVLHTSDLWLQGITLGGEYSF